MRLTRRTSPHNRLYNLYRQFSTVATSLALHTRAFLKSSRDLAPHLSSHIGPIGHIFERTPYLVAFANDHKIEFVSPNTIVSLSFSMSKMCASLRV